MLGLRSDPARRVFCDDKVTLLAGPTFLHIDSQVRTIGTCTSAVGPGNGVNFFYHKNYKCLLEVDYGWKGDLLSWDRFSPYKQGVLTI